MSKTKRYTNGQVLFVFISSVLITGVVVQAFLRIISL